MWPSPSRITGRSEVTPSMGLVTMYMCSQACSGTVTPLMRPSSRAHMPAQFTRTSVMMSPCEGLGDVGGIRLAVAGNPHRPHEVIGTHERIALARLLGADLLGLDAVGAGYRGVAPELDHTLDRPRHADAAAALPARGLARLGLEAAVEIDAVADELGQIARGAELAHEAGGVPRGPSRETPLLEQDHVTPPERGQVIGDAGADDAAADDDDPRLARQP